MDRVFEMSFGQLYPLYRAKVERKGRRPEELDGVLGWLLGMDEAELRRHVEAGTRLRDLFDQARLPPGVEQVKGRVCGVRVEEVEDPLMRRIRVMDKLVDELAKGRKVEKVIRG